METVQQTYNFHGGHLEKHLIFPRVLSWTTLNSYGDHKPASFPMSNVPVSQSYIDLKRFS